MPYNTLQLLQIEARKLGLTTHGTEKDLRRRLKNYHDRHGHLRPVQRQGAKKNAFSPRRHVTDLYGRYGIRAPPKKKPVVRRHSYDGYRGAYGYKKPDYKKAAQKRKETIRRQEAEKRREAERRRKYREAGLRLPPIYAAKPHYGHAAAKPKGHKHNYAHNHPHKDHYMGPSESKRDQLLRTCGPQCFADSAKTVPICPYCDSHSCKCRPGCDALKYAADRNIDRPRMLHYAKMLKCDWSLPPHFDDENRRKSSGSRRKSSSQRTPTKHNNLIGLSFRAPDGNTHKIIGVKKDGFNVETISSNGSKYIVPMKYVLQLIVK
jgi:hypothetical protein